MTRWRSILKLLAAMIVCHGLAYDSAFAAIEGLTFTVADNFVGDLEHMGSHKHSSNEDPPDGVIVDVDEGVAEVVDFFGDEEIRGLVEFDLTGQVPDPVVILQFQVFDVSPLTGSPPPQVGGLFGQDQYEGDIDIIHYVDGNNMENIADFDSDVTDTKIHTFDTTGFQVGDIVQLDVKTLFNEQVTMGNVSLGLRLQFPELVPPAERPEAAITFHNFRLLLQADVPEPSSVATWFVMLLAAAAFGVAKRPSSR